MMTDEQLDKFCNGMTDEQFEMRRNALIEDIETKKNFACDQLIEIDLWNYLQYEVFKGDPDKMYEALADYYYDAYDDYCENIIYSWFNNEGVDYDIE